MAAEMNQFTPNLLQSLREMKADVRASGTKVTVSQVLAAREKTGLSQ